MMRDGDDLEGALRASLGRAEERFRAEQQRALEELFLEQRGAIEAVASALKRSRAQVPVVAHASASREVPKGAHESASREVPKAYYDVWAEEDIDQDKASSSDGSEDVRLPCLPTALEAADGLACGCNSIKAPVLKSPSLQEVEKKKSHIRPRNRAQAYLLPVIHSKNWKVISILLVLSMCSELGLSVHCKVRAHFNDRCEGAGFIYGWELVNTILFSIEVFTRIIGEQRDFFCGHEMAWNLFDFHLFAINLMFTCGIMSEKKLGVLRVFRSLRMLRLLEIFPELRTMLYSICACAESVLWSSLLLFGYCWMIAIYLMEASLSYFQDVDWHKENSTLDADMIENLKSNWSSIWSSLLSLTKAVTGGADWGDLADPFFNMGSWGRLHCGVFVFFIGSTFFVLFNIVVGLIVTKSDDVGSWDRDIALANARTKFKEDMQDLEDLFDEFDTEENGHVTIDEIIQGMERPRIKAYFHHLQIDTVRADLMLKFFDTNNSRDVDKDEFIKGCLRLQGAAKPAEVAEILTLTQSINNKLNAVLPTDRRAGLSDASRT